MGETAFERWIVRSGRSASWRLLPAVFFGLGALTLGVAVLQGRGAPSLLVAAVLVLLGELALERRVFSGRLERQQEEIDRLRAARKGPGAGAS